MSRLEEWDWKELPDSELPYLDADQQLKYRMGRLCRDAMDIARRKYNAELDLSLGSIDELERILNQLSVGRPRGCMSSLFAKPQASADIHEQSKLWASYFGEMIRVHFGGNWTSELSFRPGQFGSYFSIRDIELDPVDEVHKHLQNGPYDSVRNLFYKLMERSRQ